MDVGPGLDGAGDKLLATVNPGNSSGSNHPSPPYHALPPKPVLHTFSADKASEEAKESGSIDIISKDDRPDRVQAPGNDATILPSEILQHIFSFVDPFSLGRLLLVSRLFNALLDPNKSLPSTPPCRANLAVRPQNDVWAIARRRFLPEYPRPMEEMSELEMWRLLRGSACQFCGKKPKDRAPLLAISPWNAGPGPDGVRPIWPFRCRSCGPCLDARIVKETELMLSSKSVLLHGLPSAYFTPSLNYITSVTLRSMPPPPRLQMTKYFFQPQIDQLAQKDASVREFGPAATQEWFKGLEALGKSHMKDAARFEQWHLGTQASLQFDSGSAGQMSGSTSPALSLASSAMYSHQFSLQSPHRPFSVSSTPMHPGFPSVQQHLSLGNIPPMPLQHFAPAPGQVSQTDHFVTSPFPPQHVGAGTSTFPPSTRPRQDRNSQEIDWVKTERRIEIQRRCQELDPPLQPSTLSFMDAFNAAIQIARPLTEHDWEVLKSRLAGQREEAVKKEYEKRAASSMSQIQVEAHEKTDKQRREAQDDADRIWNEIQKPSREKAREYADEYVKAHWAGGQAVNRMSSGRFAADTLMHVRRRFYETVAKEDTLLASQAMAIPPNSPIHEIRRLKLEDMRFVYEEIIRPSIDRFGREVFLCSTCEANAKRFTFDAVIQHYAAKHTSALSHGNTIVYWKADWPADPPFHPTPDAVWNRPPEHHAALPPFGSTSPAYTPAWTPYPGAGYMSPLAPGQPNGMYQVQCGELIESANRIWEATSQIRSLPNSLRVYVVIHQVAKSFSRRFTNEPTLSMFADCVEHKPLLKPLKDIGGLACKACQIDGEMSGDRYVKYQLPDLVQHFQRVHIENDARSPHTDPMRPMSMPGVVRPKLDWKFDMIDLPPTQIIQGVIKSPGINQHKLEVIAEALPAYFPPPLPQINPIPFREEGDLIHRPHIPAVRSPGLGDGSQSSSKRPFEEDHQSYPPPRRRAVEHEAYHPETSRNVRADAIADPSGEYRPYGGSTPGGHFVYMQRSYPGQDQYHERELFSQRAGRGWHPPREMINAESVRRRAQEVENDFVLPSRPQEHLSAPLSPEPVSHLGEHDDSSRAAENFLNNFDSIMSGPYEDENGPLASRLDGTDRFVDGRSRSLGLTPSQPRQGERSLGFRGGSRQATSRIDLPERHGSRNGSPIPPLDGGAKTPHRDVFASQHEDVMARNSISLGSPPIPHRLGERQHDRLTPPARLFGDNGATIRGEGAVPYEYDDYADYNTPLSKQSVYDRPPSSSELLYPRYKERQPMRYIEILPSGQRRYVEELPPSPTFERIEHFGGPQQYVDRGRYYVERADPYTNRSSYSYNRGVATIPPPYKGERNYQSRGYGPGAASAESHPPSSAGLRNMKYEGDPYPEIGPVEAHQ